MFTVIIRTVILYILVFIVTRLMGKRQIGQLQPFELAVAIMVSALAAVSMEDISIPLINSIIPILLIMSMQILVSVLSLKYSSARVMLCGKPSIVIMNGKIQESEMKNLRININDLLEQLRVAGYYNLADVEFAIFETNGQVSVLPKSQKRPVNPEDFNISTEYEGVSHSLIIDGQINYDNLNKVGLTEEWLRQKLLKFGINDASNVLLASIDSGGRLFFQEKDNTVKKRGEAS